MSVHPFDDAQLDRQVEIAAEDPDTARDMGVFEVDTKDRANRVVWRHGRLSAQLAEAEALYQAELARLNEWIEGERHRVGRQVKFLEALAETYHRRLLANDRTRKTVRLPAGDLKAQKARDHWAIDPTVFVAWAEANDREDLLRRPAPQPAKDVIKKRLIPANATNGESQALTVDGELVPGVTVHVAEETDLTFRVVPHTGEVEQ